MLLAADPLGNEIYFEDFEPDAGGFVADNQGGTITGFWHHSIGRRSDNLPGHSPGHAFYYGQFETVLGGGRYPVFADHQGVLKSPEVALPCGSSTLRFNYLLDTRPALDRDFVELRVQDVASGTVDVLLSRADGTLPETDQQWREATADLSAYAGRTIQLHFSFDTGVVEPIDPEGWYVDDVRITNQPCTVDLVTIKYVDDAMPNAGQPLEFTIGVKNEDAADKAATDVVVVDTLPIGVTYIGSSDGGVYDPADHTVRWTIPQIDVGQTVERRIQTTVDSDTWGAMLENVAVASAEEPDSNPDNNTGRVPFKVNRVDLSTTKTVVDATPNEGQRITFTLDVTNAADSNAAATAVSVVDTLPAGVTFVSATGGGVYDPAARQVTWAIAEIAAGGTLSLQVQAVVDDQTAGRLLENVVVVSADESDPEPDNNTGRTSLTVNRVDLSTTKTVDDATPNEGQRVTFTLDVTNAADSNAAATAVSVVDTLPAGVTFVSATGGGVYDPAARQVTWAIAEIAAGQSLFLQVQAVVDDQTAGRLLENVVVASADESDPEPDNNTDRTTLTVNRVDLSLLKAVDDAAPRIGQTASFTITVTNDAASNADATNIVIEDVLPAGLTVVSPQPARWTIPRLAPGQSESFSVDAVIEAGTCDETLTNQATVRADESDPNADNNTAAASVVVACAAAELAVDKQVDDATPNEGQTLTYTIDVSNAAASDRDAQNLTVIDTLPAGLQFVDATPEAVYDPADRTVSWTIDTLDIGQSRSLQLRAVVADGTAGQQLQNAVEVGDVGAVVGVAVNRVDLALEKTIDVAAPLAGHQVVYTLTAANDAASNAEASGVVVRDVLPAGVSYVSDDGDGAFDPASGRWDVGTLSTGQQQVLNVTVLVEQAAAGGVITNAATVEGVETDPDLSNNTASVTATVAQQVQFITPLAVFRPGPFTLPAEDRLAVLGRVWHDQNGNGSWDDGEVGLDGVDVVLDGVGVAQSRAVDLDGDGVIDPVRERGLYWFQQLGQIASGQHTVRVQLAGGTTASFPAGDVSHSFTLDASQPSLLGAALQTVAPNFGLSDDFISQPDASQATIIGYSWSDFDLDGSWDAGEPGRYGTQVYLDLNDDGLFDPQAEPSALTGQDGQYVFANLAAGTYRVRSVEEGLGGRVVHTFPAEDSDGIRVAAGQVVRGGFEQTSPTNLGSFTYGTWVRPADQLLGRLEHLQQTAAEDPVPSQVLAALRPWQTFTVHNTTDAAFQITGIDESLVSGRGADYLQVRQVADDGQLESPVWPRSLDPGQSAEYYVFYDPVIRSGDEVVQASPDWLTADSESHFFTASDRLVVETDGPLRFPIRLVGGSTFDSDVSYDGAVDFEDFRLLDDALLSEAVIVDGVSPRFDPTRDINTRCPNGAGQQVGTCRFALGDTPAREIGLGDIAPLNAEFGRQLSATATDAVFAAVGARARASTR